MTGPAARGVRIDAALLRDLLDVVVDGCQQVVRLNVEGRSIAHGKPPAWLERAATFELVGLHEGPTVLVVEAPSLAEAAPEHFGQPDLFRAFDLTRSCLDLFEESVRDAIAGRADSDAYDDGLLRTFEAFSRVLRHGVEAVEFGGGPPIRIDRGRVEAFERLRRAIPLLDGLDERILRQSQGPRSGVDAIFGQLADDVESDDDIIGALDRLS